MQPKILLKSFDANTHQNKMLDLQQELLKIQAEQEKIYKDKLQAKEKELEKRITQELTQKFEHDLNAMRHEIGQKSLSDNKDLIEKILGECDIYKQNCLSVMTLFMDYYIKKLNQYSIKNDIQKLLKENFKVNPEIKITLSANTNTVQSLKDTITIESVNIDFITDDTFPNGDIVCKHSDGGGVYLSEEAIIHKMHEIYTQTVGI